MSYTDDLLERTNGLLKDILAAINAHGKLSQPAEKNDVVSDAELDSEHGDELLRQKMPSKWTGEDFKGARMSDCPADLLDLIAERFEFFASKNEDEKKAGYDRRSARRARGWAVRKRNGWKSPVDEMTTSDEIGF